MRPIWKVFIAIIVLAIVVVIGFVAINLIPQIIDYKKNGGTEGLQQNRIEAITPTTGRATPSDMYLEYSQNSKYGYTVTLTAKRKIIGLQIKFSIYDENNNVIGSREKYIGDLERNETKEINFIPSQFGLSEYKKISNMSIYVKEGTIEN